MPTAGKTNDTSASTAAPVRRRQVLGGMAGGLVASALPQLQGAAAASPERYTMTPDPQDFIVVGGGVFGMWTAWTLQVSGHSVTLIDQWGVGNNLSSSGGETRLIRTEYLGNRLYTSLAWESLAKWKALSDRSSLPVFHEAGALYLYRHDAENISESLQLQAQMGIPTERIELNDLVEEFPQFGYDDIQFGIYQPTMGALMARRSLHLLEKEFLAAGGKVIQAKVQAPTSGARLDAVRTSDGESYSAGSYIFACGPWLPKVFPDVVGGRIKATRQEVFFFQPEPGEDMFDVSRMPAWVDAHEEDLHYGFPSIEGRGFKIALDKHGGPTDPDTMYRQVSRSGEDAVRAYMRTRFPTLADRPLSETRVCQYENSSTGNFLIDFHPEMKNVILVGGGTGHGFKHGPAVGRYVSELALSTLEAPEPVFGYEQHAVY